MGVAPESKATTKISPRRQTLTLAIGQTVFAGYFDKEDHDFCAFELESTLTGTALFFGVADTLAEVVAGLSLADDGVAWEGSVVEIDVTTYRKQGIDPVKFAEWRYIVPISGTVQAAATADITGLFRNFKAEG